MSRLSESVPVGLFEIDMAGHVAFTNDRMQSIVGELSASTVPALMSSVVEADKSAFETAIATVLGGQPVDDAEIRFRFRTSPSARAADAERVCDVSLRPLTDAAGTVAGAVGCLSDVTDRVQLRQELEVRASVDKLTSCLNRAAALEVLERTTAAPTAPGEGNALIFVDLDDFKSVNDRFGHAAGDRLLAEAAERLRDAARKGDSVGPRRRGRVHRHLPAGAELGPGDQGRRAGGGGDDGHQGGRGRGRGRAAHERGSGLDRRCARRRRLLGPGRLGDVPVKTHVRKGVTLFSTNCCATDQAARPHAPGPAPADL